MPDDTLSGGACKFRSRGEGVQELQEIGQGGGQTGYGMGEVRRIGEKEIGSPILEFLTSAIQEFRRQEIGREGGQIGYGMGEPKERRKGKKSVVPFCNS